MSAKDVIRTQKIGIMGVGNLGQAILRAFIDSNLVPRENIVISNRTERKLQKIAEELRSRLEKSGKEVFVFLSDEINFQSLENFNFVEVWVNTACPRIVEDFKCLNWTDLKEIGF